MSKLIVRYLQCDGAYGVIFNHCYVLTVARNQDPVPLFSLMRDVLECDGELCCLYFGFIREVSRYMAV
jgi:hypothetical protein